MRLPVRGGCQAEPRRFAGVALMRQRGGTPPGRHHAGHWRNCTRRSHLSGIRDTFLSDALSRLSKRSPPGGVVWWWCGVVRRWASFFLPWGLPSMRKLFPIWSEVVLDIDLLVSEAKSA